MYLRRHTSNAAKPIRNATSSQMYVGMNSRRAMTSDPSMNPPPLAFTECSCVRVYAHRWSDRWKMTGWLGRLGR